jgi:hypothetical protein
MPSFEREKDLVRRLLDRRRLHGEAINPNVGGRETGIDVVVRLAELADGQIVGVQVTEVDPYAVRGLARAQEKAMAKIAPAMPYFMWGQNDPSVVLNTVARIIKRKIEIAAKHSFDSFDEVWLLICAGVPEHGAVVSSFVMTPWLSAEDLNSATDSLLRGSKYNRCFLLPILGTERAFYSWNRTSRWEKFVQLEDICHVPREAHVNSLMKAAEAGNWQAVDLLCDEECRKVLAEIRQS